MEIKYFCYSKNEVVRDISTSGGFSLELSNYFYKNNGVVYGSAYTRDYNKVIVTRTTNLYQYVSLLAKSKYSYSMLSDDILSRIKMDLDNNLLVLFIGCPCQNTKIQNFLEKDYENYLNVTLYCHGYSTSELLSNFKNNIQNNEESNILSLDMRREHSLNMEILLENGKNISDIKCYKFVEKPDRMLECLKCPIRIRHFNNDCDFQIGDSWNIKSTDKCNDSKFSPIYGTNEITIHTEKGLRYFNLIKDKLNYTEFKFLKK